METCENCQNCDQGKEKEQYDDGLNNKKQTNSSIPKSNIRKDSLFLAKRRMAKQNKQSSDGSELLLPDENHSSELGIAKNVSYCNTCCSLESTNFEQTSRLSGKQQLPHGECNMVKDTSSQKQQRHVVILENEIHIIPSDDNIIDVVLDEGDIKKNKKFILRK